MSTEDKNNLIIVATFYKFTKFAKNLQDLQIEFKKVMQDNLIKGTILLAEEGINSTVSGPREGMDNFKKYLESLGLDLTESFYKESESEFYPFSKIRVRIKKEIVTFKQENLDVEKYKGHYLDSKQWDEHLFKDDVLVVDTRNQYEFDAGHFANSVNPEIERFTEFSTWVDDHMDEFKNKKVLMFCTGGIRCEKATAYLRQKGHDEVYHLKGGILQYFKDTENKDSNWKGSCFVFDDRHFVEE